VPDDVLVAVPARFVRGRSFTVRQARQDMTAPITPREMKAAWEQLERLVGEWLASADERGLLWKPLALTRSTAVVDGHPVTDPLGLKGRALSVSAFAAAVQPSVLRALEAVARRLEVTLVEVVAGPQALAMLVPQREAILIDVGWQGTTLDLIRRDALAAVHWWPQGGDFFTRSLADGYRCSSDRAEALKRAYVGGVLSPEDEDLVSGALVQPLAGWFESLVAGLSQLAEANDATLPALHEPGDEAAAYDREALLPGRIYITGGGSLLPDLVSAVRAVESAATLRFGRAVEVELLGRCLGTRWPNQDLLLDVPAHPLSDLLAPVMSLATSVVW
jgi:cell division ATPase FtsA